MRNDKEHVKSRLKNITKALHQVFDVHYSSNYSWLEDILKQNKVLSLNISSQKNKGNLTNYTSLRHYKHVMRLKWKQMETNIIEQDQKWKQMLISLTIKA
jgi:hypothetical protein